MRLYKVLFQKYSAASATKPQPLKLYTFDDLEEQGKKMSTKAVFTFLHDFSISLIEFKRRDEIKTIIKLINLKQHGNNLDVVDLDLEGYIEFMLQLGWFLF